MHTVCLNYGKNLPSASLKVHNNAVGKSSSASKTRLFFDAELTQRSTYHI